MKKKIILITACLCALLSVTACDKKDNSEAVNVGAISTADVLEYGENAVSLIWEKCENATAYEVYILDGETEKLYTTTNNTQLVVTNLEKNKEYTFRIRGINKDGKKIVQGSLIEIKACTYMEKVGKISSYLVSANSLNLKWEKAEADGYEVYSFDEETGEYLLENTVTDNNCKIVNLKPETEYSFKIIPFKNFSDGKFPGQEALFKASTVGENDICITVENVTPESYTLVWNEIDGADGYDLYVFDEEAEDFKLFKEDIKEGRVDITDLEELNSATYAVMPYQEVEGNKEFFELSTSVLASTNLSPLKLNLSAVEGGIKVSWDKSEKADGYVVYYSLTTDGDFLVAKTFEDNKTTSYTIDKLDGETKYYVKVVPFTDIDGVKLYGEEALESCTTKKKETVENHENTSTTTTKATNKKPATTTKKPANQNTYNKKNFISLEVTNTDFVPGDKRWNDISKLVKNYSRYNKTSFALYDINSGAMITHNADWYVSTASTVKAPYIMYVLSQEIDKGNAKLTDVLTYEKRFYNNGSGQIKYSSYGTKYTIKEVIHLILLTSDNCGYLMLQDHFGVKNYNKWLKSIGCRTFIDGVTVKWGNVSANDSCRIWQEIYKYFSTGKNGEFFKKELLGTGYSPIRKNLGDKYKVAAKFGGSELGWHDTGIVFAGKNPYILILLTNDSYLHPDYYYQNNMIKQLNGLHDELVKHLNKPKPPVTTTTKKPETTTPKTTTSKPVTTTPVTTTPVTTVTSENTTTVPEITTTPTETTSEIPVTTTTPQSTEIPEVTTPSDTTTEEIPEEIPDEILPPTDEESETE